MTHYNVDYSGLDEVAKHNKAIQDIKDYMGEPKFEELTGMFKEVPEPERPNLDKFELLVSFAGIQGYPAKAWYNYCYPL